jgi:outer membrane protein TolC
MCHSAMRGLCAVAAAALITLIGAPDGADAQVTGPIPPSALSGGVPAGTVTDGPVDLTLHDAIQRGLDHNLGIILGRQRLRAADGARWMAMSGLLPTVGVHIAESNNKINLEAYGFPVAPGESPIIGPFSVSDRRISVSQSLFDLSAIDDARAGAALKSAAEFGYQDVREQVVIGIANLYFQAVASTSRIESARAQLRTAEALYDRAVSMKQAGTVAGIEVVRAQVQVENHRQLVITSENDLAKQKLALARAIGMPLGQAFTLTDRVPYKAFDAMPLDQALAQALGRRADYKAMMQLVKSAEASRQAAWAELLPSLHLTADYGDIGPTWGSALGTFSVMAAVRIPLFQAGRERGRILQADSALQQANAQAADLKARIEYDVRTAFLDLHAADDRVHVAQVAADLAAQQLTQTQDRYSAGVASHVEVVQAQDAVATASDNLINSLFAHNLAKAAVARALGVAEQAAERLLGGQQ